MDSEIVERFDVEGDFLSMSFAQHKEGTPTVLFYSKERKDVAFCMILTKEGVQNLTESLFTFAMLLDEWVEREEHSGR